MSGLTSLYQDNTGQLTQTSQWSVCITDHATTRKSHSSTFFSFLFVTLFLLAILGKWKWNENETKMNKSEEILGYILTVGILNILLNLSWKYFVFSLVSSHSAVLGILLGNTQPGIALICLGFHWIPLINTFLYSAVYSSLNTKIHRITCYSLTANVTD